MRTTFIIIVASLLVSSCRQTTQQSPDKVATEYLTARYEYTWDTLSRLIDSHSLENFKKFVVADSYTLDSLDLAKHGSTKPDSVLNYLRNEEVKRLSPRDYFVSVMRVILPTQIMRSAYQYVPPTVKCFGYVMEGTDTAHAILRLLESKKGLSVNLLETITVVRDSGEWKILLPDELRKYMVGRLWTQHQF